MSTSYPWIYMIPGLLNLVFYIGALIILMGKYRRHPQAARLAIIGIAILLLTNIGSWISTWILSRFVDSGNFLMFHGMIQFVLSLAHLFAMGIILAAVFVARRPTEADPWGATDLPPSSDNPYASPTTR